MLTFDPDTHVYTYDGQPVPSVTQILKEAGVIDTQWYTGDGAIRGQCVAEATALDDEGELDETSLDPALAGYMAAWRKFVAETGIIFQQIETPLFHNTLRYAGTPDRIATWAGKPCVIDIKTGGREDWHGLQLAAYAGMVDGPHSRCGVYLGPEGTYKARQFTDGNDWLDFMACLRLCNRKRRNNK